MLLSIFFHYLTTISFFAMLLFLNVLPIVSHYCTLQLWEVEWIGLLNFDWLPLTIQGIVASLHRLLTPEPGTMVPPFPSQELL